MARRYLLTFWFSLLLVVTTTAGFVGLIDPWGIFHDLRIGSLNSYKRGILNHLYLNKPYAVMRRQPTTIIVGSSRAGQTLSPSNPALGSKAYNLSVPGASMYVALRHFQHALTTGSIRRVILGLEMNMFNAHRKPIPAFSESRLAVTATGKDTPLYPLHKLADYFSVLFSVDGLHAAIDTARATTFDSTVLESDGAWYHPHPPQDQIKSFRKGLTYYMNEAWFPEPEREFSLSTESSASQLEAFRAFLRLAHKRELTLYIYIHPNHALHLEAMARVGLWSTFEIWQKELVRINAEEAKRARQPPFPLRDFSGYNRYTTEPIPEPGSGPMRWHVENSHYTRALGNKVLDILLGNTPSTEDEFGILLNTTTLAQHQAFTRRAKTLWESTHPEDVALVWSLPVSYPVPGNTAP